LGEVEGEGEGADVEDEDEEEVSVGLRGGLLEAKGLRVRSRK
jgi:hypothetical protein